MTEPNRIRTRFVHFKLALVALALLPVSQSRGIENPTSTGEVAQVDTPILRIPFMKTPPKIDGEFTEKEWEDASALSGFWYDFASAKFVYLAPDETQVQVYAAFDKENFYLCCVSPVYPEKSWMKARARFPDVIGHPLYGLQWDDHYEIELRPYADNVKAFRMGLFKWFVNPTNTYSDQLWSQQFGNGMRYKSKMKVRSMEDGKNWVLEMATPLKSFVHQNYAGKDEDGTPIVDIPPPDGTAYRCWFTRGIGGNGNYFNVFDNHSWNTTKTKLIFDSKCVGFQLNDLGPIMKDTVDLKITLKNHNDRSETVRLGFFVENEEGLIYSSYDDRKLKDGLVELVPGQVEKIRLKKRFPKISTDGNGLWFDVRSMGRPAKPLFRTRLIEFHSMDGGVVDDTPFKWRRLDCIARMRPPRKDFEHRYAYSNYNKKLSVVVDKGIHGASPEAKSAVEAKVVLMTEEDEDEILTKTVPFRGNFACLVADVPDLKEGKYTVWLLLFDKNKRIVGEANCAPFTKQKVPWERNPIGRNDIVWEPFTPMQVKGDSFGTLKHRFDVDASGLPKQIVIRGGVEDRPLELRGADVKDDDPRLIEVGRGPQLRAPMRLQATIGGKTVPAKVVEKAKLTKQWKSELIYEAKLQAGPVDLVLKTQYDCDGAMTVELTYGSNAPVEIEKLELIMDVAGQVDTIVPTKEGGGGMASADRWECTLPDKQGVVWDSAKTEHAELFYTHFVPWLWFGTGDRAFTWICDSDQYWTIDRDGSTMRLERNAKGEVTWRAFFVNHKAQVKDAKTIKFMILTHPSKPKVANHREMSWNYRGPVWADGYMQAWGPLDKSDARINMDRVIEIEHYKARGVPEDKDLAVMAEKDPYNFHAKRPPWKRFYQLRGKMGPMSCVLKNSHTGDLLGINRAHPEPATLVKIVDGQQKKFKAEGRPGVMCQMNEAWQDLFVYWMSRHVKIARRHGWWWDETWPVYRNNCLATGAHLRDPKDVRAKTEDQPEELPWHPSFLTMQQRGFFKRFARVFKEAGVPNRNHFWANNSATAFESFGFDTQLVEECAADPKSRELDNVVCYPISLFRYAAHGYTGLVSHIVSLGIDNAGANKVYDRQYIGRGLLHDIGVQPYGPHGKHPHVEQFMRVINRLYDFGYYQEKGTEFFPYWRNGKAIGVSAAKGSEKVYVSVYRRAFEQGGKKGTHAVIAVMNENDKPIDVSVLLKDVNRIVGGANNLTAGDVHKKFKANEKVASWWQAVSARKHPGSVLMDLENGDIVPAIEGKKETYGPLHIRAHDYRLLYARHVSR